MKLGAEQKKLAFLGGLLLLGGYLFYSNVLSDSGGGPPPPSATKQSKQSKLPDPASVLDTTPAASKGPVRRAPGRAARLTEEFRPTLKRKPEDMPDPTTIDPTLRNDLLAKVQGVEVPGTGRNLFAFSAPPVEVPKDVPKVKPGPKMYGPPPPPPPVKPETPKAPVTPPLNLSWKYFGYTLARGDTRKKAFFLDGEEILSAAEGEVIKRRYRVVRIGVNSVVMEDTETKKQQTLPLLEEAATG